MTPHPLYDWLALAVPLALGELAASGGPTRLQWHLAQRFGVTLGAKGDQILFRDKETAALASTLARTLAVLAYAPGGCTFGPHHWEVP